MTSHLPSVIKVSLKNGGLSFLHRFCYLHLFFLTGSEVIVLFFPTAKLGNGRKAASFEEVDLFHVVLSHPITLAVGLYGDEALHHSASLL